MQDQTGPVAIQTTTGFEQPLPIEEPLDQNDDRPETVPIRFLPLPAPQSRRLPNGIEYSPLND